MTDIPTLLAGMVGPRGLLTDAADMAPYASDWRGKLHGEPLAVVRPANTAEVAAVVRLCAEHGLTLVPQGGNTGLAGGATPDRSGRQIVVSLDRMTAIRAVDPVDNVIVAEAGCVLASAQAAADAAGRLLPLSFAAEGSARLGGAIATNAGGLNVLRYGNARALVLGLEVVLPDGTVLDALGRLRKDNAGYDLKQVFIGAEGTLGIITAVSLRLFPQILQRQTAVLLLPSLEAVLGLKDSLGGALGEFLSSLELISPFAAHCALDHLPKAHWPFAEGWSVLVEIGSSNPHIDLGNLFEQALVGAIEDGLASDVVIAQSEAQRLAMWLVRESITEGERALGPSIKHDVSVPLSRLPAAITACEAGIDAQFAGARVNAFGHVGDGNIHFNVIPTADQWSRPDLEAAINHTVHDLIVAEGGSITAEHGVGQMRAEELALYKSAAAIDLMRRIKHAIDPATTMNPGKVLTRQHR